MSGRGRGRGGRGGGGAGISKSFNREQLNSMGIASNEFLPGPVTQPPPLYPLLDRKPIPLINSRETDYLLILKQDFIDRMQLSGSYLTLPNNNKQPELEIDKLMAQIPRAKEQFDWSLFPSELRPKVLAKRIRKVKTGVQNVNVQERLTQLEKIEESNAKTTIKEEAVESDENEEVEEEQDEEMDDGTDYANNYFDNGEDYEDEDDNLDDGPIF